MFNSNKTRDCLKSLIGWKDHYDLSEIDELSDGLKVSETGEYYQEKHPALRLDLIKATLPSNMDLEEFLIETENSAITELLNDITVLKQLSKTTKELVANDVIYNSEGWIDDTILNEGMFVGIRFRPILSIGLKATINRLALQLTEAQNGLELYLFHSHKSEYLAKLTYTTTKGGQFNWIEANIDLKADDKDLSGGSFYIGYYQDHIIGNAIQYKKLNWSKGYCSSCDGGISQSRYKSISRYVDMQPFYVPASSLPSNNEEMFNPDNIIIVDDNNWGFNFNISIKCDLTNFFCDNRFVLKNALSLKVVQKILKHILYSQQINYVEEQLKMMIIRDLEGDKETNYINLSQQYERSLKAINFSYSSINRICLPCSKNSGVTYGTV